MSKGSNTDDINIAYLDKLTEAVIDMTVKLDKISPSYGAHGQLEKELSNLAKYVQSGDMTLKQMLKEGAAAQKNIRSVEYGLESTSKYNRTVNMFIKLLEEKIKDSEIDDVLIKKLTTAFENLDVTAILESEKIGQRGGKGAPLKNVMDNEKLNKVNEDLAKRIGLKMDEAQYKLMTFFQEQEQKRDKKTASFVNDLIEGLEKSKWVGGALRDTFRLVGLLGANWLSQFGQLGKILGGAFYVAMETAGPLLVKLLLQGMGKLFTALPRMLGNFGKGIWGAALNASMKAGGPLADFVTAGKGQKLAAGGRLATAGLVAAGLGTGAFFAGRESINSFKQGDKVGGSAFGIGAAGLGIAAIAAVIAGITAPVTLIAAAIGGIAVAVGAIWKNREKLAEHYKKNKEFYDKVLTFFDFVMPIFGVLRHSVDWLVDHWPWGREDKEGQKNGFIQGVKNLFGIQDKKAVQHIGGVGLNKAGGVIGVEKLDKMTASRVAEEYFRQNPEQASNIYEKVGSRYASLGDFQNDWAIRNTKGQATEAILYAGASQNLEKMWEALVSSGAMTKERAELMKYTSGRSTLSSPHAKGGKHENVMNMVTDLGAASWTDSEWQAATEVLSPMLASMGFKLKYEGVDKKGKTHFSDKFEAGLSNRHFHVELLNGYENMAPEGAKANIANYKAISDQHSIEVKALAQMVDPIEVQKKREELFTHGVSELSTNDYMNVLKKNKVYKDENTGSWMRETGRGTEALWMNNNTGNYEWRVLVQTMQNASQYSANGRS